MQLAPPPPDQAPIYNPTAPDFGNQSFLHCPASTAMKVFVTLALFAVATFAEPPSYRQQQQQQNGNRYFFARQQDQSAAASGPYAPSGWRPEGPAFNLPQRQERQQQQPDSGYGAPEQQQQQQQYGPPPSNQYGPPQAGLNNLRRPQFARQELPAQQQYGAPSVQEPQQKYGGPSPAPVEQYRAPVRQQQFRAPARQQQYPTAPTPQQYGPPQAPQTQYGPAENQYGGPEYTTTEIPNAAEIDEPTTISQFTESEAESGNNEFEEEADIDNPSGRQQKSQKQQQQQQQDRGEYYVALPDGRLQRVRYVSEQDIEAMRYFAKIRAENVEPLRGPIYAYAPLQELEVAPGKLQVSLAPAAPVGSLTVASSDARPQKLQAAPKLDIKPLTQVQLQHDAPASVVPLSSSYTTFTANYQVPAAPADERYILAFP